MEIEKPKITKEIRDKLRADFPQDAYKKHPTKTFLTTLKAMYIVERLNDVFGIGRWTLTHSVELTTDSYVLIKGKLLILDYDCDIPEQYGGHQTKGTNVEIADGYKSAITDVLSKTASYLEIGIEMFKGEIIVGSNKSTKTPSTTQKEVKNKTLTAPEVENKWNGKIYKGNSVYIDNILYVIPADQVTKLKAHKKYKEN